MGFCRVRGGRDTDFMAAVVRAYRDRQQGGTVAAVLSAERAKGAGCCVSASCLYAVMGEMEKGNAPPSGGFSYGRQAGDAFPSGVIDAADALLFTACPGLQLLEKVVSLVVNKDEGREVLDGNLPDCLHTQFGILNAFDARYAALRQHCRHASDGSQIETAVLLTSVGNGLRTVSLGNHHQGAAVCLKFVNVWVHTVGGCRAH